MKYFLIGFMGSGKSTIAKLLSDQLGLDYLDLDLVIEEKLKSSVSKIFSDHGEKMFRNIEEEFLDKILQFEKDYVLSTGGGTPCFHSGIDKMKAKGKVIYLQVSKESLTQRLIKATNSRPLIDGLDESDLNDFIEQKLKERSVYYEKADIIIQADQNPEQIVAAIISKIKENQWL